MKIPRYQTINLWMSVQLHTDTCERCIRREEVVSLTWKIYSEGKTLYIASPD